MKRLLGSAILIVLVYIIFTFSRLFFIKNKHIKDISINDRLIVNQEILHVKPILSNKTHNEYFKHRNNSKFFEKWIVIVTTNEPTQRVLDLAKEKGFRLLIVADKKKEINWDFKIKNVTYLSSGYQKKFKHKNLVTSSHTRKNIGYLYAIRKGARLIYDADDDYELIFKTLPFFDLNSNKYELEYDCKSPLVVNPYQQDYNNYNLIKKPKSFIEKAVLNNDIINFTETNVDLSLPSIRVPLYRLTPFNTRNTMFHYQTLWALYTPHVLPVRIANILRSYWSQRLLWLIDSTISFHCTNFFEIDKNSSYSKLNENSLDTDQLIKLLNEWKCKNKTFYKCVIDLSKKIADKKFWSQKEVISIKNWLNDLTLADYIEPKIINFEYEQSKDDFEFNKENNNICKLSKYKNGVKVKYELNINNLLEINTKYQLEVLNYFENYCKSDLKLSNDTKLVGLNNTNKNSTILIVLKNISSEDNVLFLTNFYYNIFKNVILCGDKFDLNSNIRKHFKKFNKLIIINESNNYDCLSKVIKMNYKTNGILVTNDETLLKYWEIENLNKEKLLLGIDSKCETFVNSSQLNRTYFFLKNLTSKAYGFKEYQLNIIKKFLDNLKTNLQSNLTNFEICNKETETFYLPMRHFDSFDYLRDFFHEANVLYKFMLPNIILGIETHNKLEIINENFIWYRNHYNASDNKNLFSYANNSSSLINKKTLCETLIYDSQRHQ